MFKDGVLAGGPPLQAGQPATPTPVNSLSDDGQVVPQSTLSINRHDWPGEQLMYSASGADPSQRLSLSYVGLLKFCQSI